MPGANPIVIPKDVPPPISKQTIPIAGLLVDIYGLQELPTDVKHISALWLHHPRACKKEDMSDMAALAISNWNGRRSGSNRGLIGIAFDQRHHGSRAVGPGPADDRATMAWREGNPMHALDMFGMVTGMVVDTGLLMDAVEGYVGLPARIDQHLALGVSLGGHSVWQLMFKEPRCAAGVVVIGCPDYTCKWLATRCRYIC
jgi:hypothetical protein